MMGRTIKFLAAGAALVAPVALGWGYTVGATVGEGGGGFFSDHTVDEFLVDDHLVTREGSDGVITMTVIGPDGAAVAIADLPAAIADQVAFYESEWHPNDSSSFEVNDGDACYRIDEDLGPNEDLSLVEDRNGVFRVIEATADADGQVTVGAAQFGQGVLSGSEQDGLHDGSMHLDDLSGGTPIEACDD